MKKKMLDRCGGAIAIGMILYAVALTAQWNEESGEVKQTGPISDVKEDQAEHKVVSVNRDWGFVIVEGLDDSNLVKDAQLGVFRDGNLLANLRVTVVEGERVVADILPGSLNEGTDLLPGDIVR